MYNLLQNTLGNLYDFNAGDEDAGDTENLVFTLQVRIWNIWIESITSWYNVVGQPGTCWRYFKFLRR